MLEPELLKEGVKWSQNLDYFLIIESLWSHSNRNKQKNQKNWNI